MKKLPLAIVLGMIALLFVLAGQSKFGLFATVAQQTEVTLPEPDLSAFPVPIVKAITKKIGEYPIDTNLTTFQSLKREINTDLLPVGDHVFFASNKTVYRLTRGEKRTLEFPSPLTRVITDWQQRLFVMTSDRWVYVFDVNTLQKIGKFQVKYNQKVSEFVYLSDNIILVGFDFWKDEAQKKPNTWVAVAYTLNGQEKWKIKNMGMSGNNLDRRSFFEVLQVGTRGFLASCCNSSVRKEPYDGALQNAFAYENKTGILKVGEVNRGLQEPNPPNFELENSDSELYTYTEKALNLSDFRYLPIAPDKIRHIEQSKNITSHTP